MSSYRVTYRDEFSAVIQAENAQQALKKFRYDNQIKIAIARYLHEEFFQIENQDSGIIVKKSGLPLAKEVPNEWR